MAPPPNPPSARHHPATPPRRRNARNLTRMPWTKCTLTCWAASSDRYLLSVTSALVFRDSYYSLKHLNHIFESIMFDFFCKTIWQARKCHEMPIATEWWTDPDWSHYRLITFPSWWSLNIQQPTDVCSITDVNPLQLNVWMRLIVLKCLFVTETSL